MKNIFISSTLFWNCPLEEMLSEIHNSGAEGIELWAQQFTAHKFDTQEYLQLASKYQLKTLVHSYSWDLNLASINPAIRQTSVQEILTTLELAQQIGATEVTIHPGHLSLNQPSLQEVSENLLLTSLQEIYEAARWFKVTVSVEIMEKISKEFLTSPHAMEKYLGVLFNQFHYTLDTAHCESEDEVVTYLKKAKRLSKIHLSNRLGPKYHTALEDGDFNFDSLLSILESYNLPLVVEGFDATPEHHLFHKNITFLKDYFMQTQLLNSKVSNF